MIEITGEGKSAVATPDGKKPKEEVMATVYVDTFSGMSSVNHVMLQICRFGIVTLVIGMCRVQLNQIMQTFAQVRLLIVARY